MDARRRHDIDYATARRIAVAADVDPRTVMREVAKPGSVRGMAGGRVRSALAAARAELAPGAIRGDRGPEAA